MTEKDLDIAIEKCERIMEFDTRTLKNPESENGYIFERVYDLLQFLRQLQFSTNAVPVVRCKDCLHNRACEIQYHAQAWDLFFCGAAERKDGDDG